MCCLTVSEFVILFIVAGFIIVCFISLILFLQALFSDFCAPKPLKKEQKFINVKKSFNVGKTQILVTFQDGKKFKISVYGHVGQHHEEIGGETWMYNSLVQAQNVLRGPMNRIQTFVNDDKSPTESYTGVVLSMKILDTSTHYVDLQTRQLEE